MRALNGFFATACLFLAASVEGEGFVGDQGFSVRDGWHFHISFVVVHVLETLCVVGGGVHECCDGLVGDVGLVRDFGSLLLGGVSRVLSVVWVLALLRVGSGVETLLGRTVRDRPRLGWGRVFEDWRVFGVVSGRRRRVLLGTAAWVRNHHVAHGSLRVGRPRNVSGVPPRDNYVSLGWWATPQGSRSGRSVAVH